MFLRNVGKKDFSLKKRMITDIKERCDLMAKTVIEEIRSDLYRAEIPLPRNPLKATNSYIIKGKPRNLVIDTGMNREECKAAMLDAFSELDVKMQDTDYFVTHVHADHVGLVDELSSEDAKIYFNQPDADVLNYKNLWQLVCTLTARHGFPTELVDMAVDSHPGKHYSPKGEVKFSMVNDGDILNYGSFELRCVVTPGHTSGHTCLYEPHLKYLFSGDHILGDITPNISTWIAESNPLWEYFKSLDKVYAMPVDLVLPGHRSLIYDCRSRIEELKKHHRMRLEEVMEILSENGPKNAYEVASKMTWDLLAAGWEEFPLMQKWFATGEALAHIRYLEVEGRVKRGGDEHKQVYFVN